MTNLNENMYDSEKIFTLQNQMKNNQSMLSSNSLLSPTSKNNYYNYSTRNPQKQNFNQTEFNINPSENLNASSQMYYKTLNSPLYNFRNRVGNSNNNISAFNTYNRLNKSISNNNQLGNLNLTDSNPKTKINSTTLNNNETLNDFHSNNLNLTNLNSSFANGRNSSNIIASNVQFNTLKEENEKLKNHLNVLNKNNMDLKNQVKLLQIELSAVNTTTNYSFTNRVIDDPELLNYIENLKSSLAQAQNSNNDLCDMYENLQNKHMDITKEKIILKEQYENMKNEFNNFNKSNSENRLNLEEVITDLRNCENDRTNLLLNKNDFEEKYKLAEEKIENLLSINETNLKCKSDNLEMIENLKNTINVLRKNNDDSLKNELMKKLEHLENLLEEKELTLKNVNQKLKNYENDRDYYNQELKLMEKEFKDKQNFIEDLQHKYHEAITEVEKSKSRIEALNINLSERDQTINNLKTSMNFITGTIEDYKVDYERFTNQTESESVDKIKLLKELDYATKKANDLSELYNDLIADKENLQKKNIEIEKELNIKKNVLTKLTFENEVLNQKINNNKTFIESLQEEMKNSKFNKINEEFQNEISKSNDERNKRLKEIEKQISVKNKLIEDLQGEIRDINNEKEKRISELQKIISKKNLDEKDLENKMNEKVADLKGNIEISRQEILNFKNENELEKSNLKNEIERLKQENRNLQARYNSLNKSFEDHLNRNVNTYVNNDATSTTKVTNVFNNDNNNYMKSYNANNAPVSSANYNSYSSGNNKTTITNINPISNNSGTSNQGYNSTNIMKSNPTVSTINNPVSTYISNNPITSESTNIHSKPNTSSGNYFSNLVSSNLNETSSINIDAILKKIMESSSEENNTNISSQTPYGSYGNKPQFKPITNLKK